MRGAKLGKVIYLKTTIKMSEAILWANLTQMSMLRASIRLFNRLLIYLAALPRHLGRGTTWRHIAFLMGREPCSAREGGGIVMPRALCLDQWILLKFVFLRQISEGGGGEKKEKKKSMRAMDSTCLKGNVSNCQGLSFQSSLPEFAVSAICRELKGKTVLAEDPSDSRNTLVPVLLASY